MNIPSRSLPRDLLRKLAQACALVLALGSPGVAAAIPPGPAPLRPLDERTLGIGESYHYYFPMKAGEYLRIDVEQNDDIDAGIRLFDSQGKLLFHANSYTGTHGAETMSWIAEREGVYRVEVYCWEDQPGRYWAFVDGPRNPNSYDRRRALASAALFQGTDSELSGAPLTSESTESRYRDAVRLWRGLREPRWTAVAERQLGRFLYDHGAHEKAIPLYWSAWPWLLSEQESALLVESALILSRWLVEQRHGYKTAPLLGTAASYLSAIYPEQSFGYANDLREVAERAGQLEFAAIFARKSVHAARALKNAPALVKALANYSRISRRLGRLAEAQEAAETAIRFAQGPSEQVRAAWALAMVKIADERPAEAVSVLEAALSLDLSAGDRADFYQYLGRSYLEAEQFSRAVVYLTLAADGHQGPALALDLSFLALAELRRERLPEATEALERASKVPLEAKSNERAFLFRVAAEVARARGEWSEAVSNLEETLFSLAWQRDQTSAATLRAALWSTRSSYLEFAFDLLYAAHKAEPGRSHLERAFLEMERSRAPVLIERLRTSNQAPRSPVRGLDLALRRLDDRLAEVRARRPSGWRQAERALERERKETVFDAQLTEVLVSGAGQRRPAASHSLSQLRAQLEPDETFLAFFLGRNRSFLWILSRSDFFVRILPPRAQIEAEINRTLADMSSSRQADFVVSSRLTRLLLGDSYSLLKTRRLILSLDGELHRVAFSALPALETDLLLIDRFEIVTVPSLTALALLRKDVRSCSGAGLVTNADPRSSMNLDKDALQELDAHVTNIPANRSQLLGGSLSRHCVVHFAVHGASDESWPDTGMLMLGPSSRLGNQPVERLYAFEIESLSLDSSLVVLAACNSAQGSVRGEGLYGLPRAFLAAGARSVVGALWAIDGRATGELMKNFYLRLAKGETASAALRSAQIDLRNSSDRSAPYFWAGLQLVGDPGFRL